MDATELFKSDGTTAGIFYCGKCRIVARTKDEASQCCAQRLCECGQPVRDHYTACQSCMDKKDHQRECDKFAAAEKLTIWDGPVYKDGYGHGDGFFEDFSALEEYVEDEGMKMPSYVWTCDRDPIVALDYDSIIEDNTQEAHENFDAGNLDGAEQLIAALAAFNEANKDEVNWNPNYKRALLTAPPAAKERDEE